MAPKEKAELSLEAALSELEGVVKELEKGDLPLEKALELFERGVQLNTACRKQLEQAETRIEILLKKDGETQPEPFEPENS